IDFEPLFVDPNAQEIPKPGKKGATSKRSASRSSSKPPTGRSSKKEKEVVHAPVEKLYRAKAITVYPGCKLPALNVYCLTNVNPDLEAHAKVEDAKQLEEFNRNREEELMQLPMLEMQTRKQSMRRI